MTYLEVFAFLIKMPCEKKNQKLIYHSMDEVFLKCIFYWLSRAQGMLLQLAMFACA